MTNGAESDNEMTEAFRSLAASFGEQGAVRSSQLTLNEVRSFVAAHVAGLLDNNPGLLMSILYRIDVAEPKVRQVLECEPAAAIVDRLTALIIERQLEKVRLRRRFREQEND